MKKLLFGAAFGLACLGAVAPLGGLRAEEADCVRAAECSALTVRGGIPTAAWFYRQDQPGYQYVFYVGNKLLSLPNWQHRYSAGMNAAASKLYAGKVKKNIMPRETRQIESGGSEYRRFCISNAHPVYGNHIYSGHTVVLDFALDDRGLDPLVAAKNVDAILRQIWDFRALHSRIVVYAATPEMLKDYAAGKTPKYIEECEKVCAHWDVPSINLCKAAAEAVKRGELAADDFFAGEGGMPNAKAGTFYYNVANAAMERLLQAKPMPENGWQNPYPEKNCLYPDSNPRGKIVAYEDNAVVRSAGWKLGMPSPMMPFGHVMVADKQGEEFSFEFDNGSEVGVMDAANAESAPLEWSVDGGEWRRIEPPASGTNFVFRHLVLAKNLDQAKKHKFTLRVAGPGVARIGGILLCGDVDAEGKDPFAGLDPKQGCAWQDKLYSMMEPVVYAPPKGRFAKIPETARRLREGGAVRCVMLGDSITQDTMGSQFDNLVRRRYPKCDFQVINSTRSGTGCNWYAKENRIKEYVLDHNPDLLVICGISHGKDPEVVRDVIKQVRAARPGQEILVITPVFGGFGDTGDFDAKLEQICKDEKCAFFDQMTPLKAYIEATGKVKRWFMRDPCHANRRGMEILGRLLDAWFAQPADVALVGDGNLSCFNWWPVRYIFARYRDAMPEVVFKVLAGQGSTAQLRGKLEDGLLGDVSPKAMVLMTGSDDYAGKNRSSRVAPAKTLAEVRKILEYMKAKHPQTLTVVTAVPPLGKQPDAPLRKWAHAVNRELVKLVDGTHSVFANPNPAYMSADGTLSEEMFFDAQRATPNAAEILINSFMRPVGERLAWSGDAPRFYGSAVAGPAEAGQWEDGLPSAAMPISKMGEPWWAERMMLKQDEIAALGGECDVAMVGDSITQNWESENSGGPVLAELRKRWKIMPLGYGGDGTSHVVWRCMNGELDGYRAKLVTLMIGTNNTGEKPENVAAAIKRMLAVIKEKQPQAKILLMPIFPRGKTPQDRWNRQNMAVNEIIKGYADGEKVLWLDMGPAFRDAEGNWIGGRMGSDNLHPVKAGYEAWAEALTPIFEKVAGAGRKN